MQRIAPTNFTVIDGVIHVRKVETLAAFHCNLSCRGCVHGSPALGEKFLDPASLERDLSILAPVMRIHKLALLGGEPLLHPRLEELARVARASGAVEKIAVISNGVGVERISDELLASIDVIEISVYPRVRLRFTEDELRQRARAHGVQVGWNVIHRFQQTTVNERIADHGLVDEIFQRCKPRNEWSCHSLHEGRYFKCSRAGLLEDRLRECGHVVSNKEGDGVSLRSGPQLFDALLAYLRSDVPLEACHWCLGSDGEHFAHQLQNARQVREEVVRIVPLSATQFTPTMRRHLVDNGLATALADLEQDR